MENETDEHTRRIVVGKDCYAKYCSRCHFMIKSEWSPKQGFRYGWIDVVCCVNGGKWIDDGQPICPSGVVWQQRLGTVLEFDPEKLYDTTALKRMYKDYDVERKIEGKGYFD